MDSQQIGLAAGIALIVIGTMLLIISLLRRRRITVQAHGGIAIGGNVKDSNLNNQSSSSAAPAQHSGHGLTIIAIVVELVGIAVTLWHASHMAALA